MSKEIEFTRREFLRATTKTGVGLAALRRMGWAAGPGQAEENHTSPHVSNEPAGKAKGTWPQEYTVQRDSAAGELTLSTPYYSFQHDLNRGGAIARIRSTHGKAPNLLLEPMGAFLELPSERSPIRRGPRRPRRAAVFSDLHDSSPSVSVEKSGKGRILKVEATLRTPSGHDVGVRTRTTYVYRWGYIKIHKEFVFPARAVHTSRITVLSTTFHPSLTHYGHRPDVFENSDVSPFGIEKVRWGELRPGQRFDEAFGTRYVPRYLVLANPGIEGIEWFVSDDLSEWDYQMTGKPGTGNTTISPNLDPLGNRVSISPLDLPSRPGLARGGFVSLAGLYSFDYYLAVPILEGHAHQRWLERSYNANRGQWVSDDEIRRNAEHGIVTMTLHSDGDAYGDGLYWRDGTYPPYPPEQMKKMEHVIATCHQYGIKTMPYFSNHELNESTEAFKEHGEEWGMKPDDQGNLSPAPYYGIHMCLKSGWLRHFESTVDTVLKHQPFDGIYYDWNVALYCNNPLHVGKASNGISGSKGLASYAFSPTGHWDIDELLELMEWTRERVGPDGLVTLHNTMAPMFATENFADFVVGMEWGYGKLREGMPKPDELPLEWNFAGARSRADIEYGTIARDAPARIHRLFHLTTLMTGTAPWPASYEAADLFKILAPLGNLESYQFEDWRNRAVWLGGKDYLSAIYSRPGDAYILLANLRPEARQPIVKIDPRAILNPMASVHSAFLIDKDKKIPVEVQKLVAGRFLLPGEGVRLLHLKG